MGRRRKIRNTLLIDADILVYKVAARCERVVCWDEDNEIWSVYADLKEAKLYVRKAIEELEDTLGGLHVILCFSQKRTFRHELYDLYKSNRKKNRPPIILRPLREWAQEEWHSESRDRLEADDLLGILSKSRSISGPKIVVSDDHDLEAIPCTLYQPMHPERGIRRITYKSAKRQHLYQTLTGDSGDGYPGLPGVGPKRADAILKEGTWEEVVEAYVSKGLNEREALLQARLAKVLTPPLYNINTGEIKLWRPGR